MSTDLKELHDSLARELAKIIKEGTEVVLGKGEHAEVVNVTAAPGYFGAALALLKHNDIRAVQDNDPAFDELKRALAARKKIVKEAFDPSIDLPNCMQ